MSGRAQARQVSRQGRSIQPDRHDTETPDAAQTSHRAHGSIESAASWAPYTGIPPIELGTHALSASRSYVSSRFGSVFASQSSFIREYFRVNNAFVLAKSLVVLCPFTHRSWHRAMQINDYGELEGFLPPEHDTNSPDLYIPLMSLLTLFFIHALKMGQSGSLRPEHLATFFTRIVLINSIESAYTYVGAYLLGLAGLALVDVTGYLGYKFIHVCALAILSFFCSASIMAVAHLYSSISLMFFILRSLRYILTNEQSPSSNAVYFLVSVSLIEVVVSFYLTRITIFVR